MRLPYNRFPVIEATASLAAEAIANSHDIAQLLPPLLDQLAVLGDIAKQISTQLGGNGHRAGEVQKLLEEIARR